MRVIEPGHIYEVHSLDGGSPLQLVFVNREATPHPGTQTQEILRVLIDMLSCLVDRTNHCDDCLRWDGNDKIVKAMTEAQRQCRLAILLHEQRVLERKLDKDQLLPERATLGADGHFVPPRGALIREELNRG